MPITHGNRIGTHYQTVGKGPDIVMIHGLAANLAFWHLPFAPSLSLGFRFTTYDLRGHGYSDMPQSGYTSEEMARDLLELMDHIGIEQANIVGHSFGGSVALHFAVLFPERVKTVTLADGRIPSLQPLPKQGEGHYWRGWRNKIQNLGFNVPDDMPYVVYSFVEEIAREKNVSRELRFLPFFASFGNWAPNKRTGKRWRRLLQTTSALSDFTDPAGLTEDSICQIRLPVLAIYGEYSHCLPTCNRLAQLLPKYTKIILPGVGHFHPLVRPANFTEKLINFLKIQD